LPENISATKIKDVKQSCGTYLERHFWETIRPIQTA